MVIVLYQEWSWNMKNLKRVILLFVVSALLSLSAQSQDPAMKGRSGIELDCGLWTGPNASTAVGMEGIGVDVTSNAFVGGILFTHWVQEYLSITVSAGLLEGKASSTVSFLSVTQHVSSVVQRPMGRFVRISQQLLGRTSVPRSTTQFWLRNLTLKQLSVDALAEGLISSLAIISSWAPTRGTT